MRIIIILLIAITIVSCEQKNENIELQKNDSLENKTNLCNKSEHLAQSILWFQLSPEMHALYIQSYNSAKSALDFNLKNKKFPNKKNAVVLDIDETVLNNSLYEGWLYLNNKSYNPTTWVKWVNDAKAEPLPGTVDFLNYVKSKNCEVFYVSNRNNETALKQTIVNLKKYNLPFADESHVLLKTKSDTTISGKTTKEIRRNKIENELNYEILLLLGDQIADFDKAFDYNKGGTEVGIKDSISKYSKLFNTKFILLPNPMYSGWLSKIINKNSKNDSCTTLLKNRKLKIQSWK